MIWGKKQRQMILLPNATMYVVGLTHSILLTLLLGCTRWDKWLKVLIFHAFFFIYFYKGRIALIIIIFIFLQ